MAHQKSRTIVYIPHMVAARPQKEGKGSKGAICHLSEMLVTILGNIG